MKDSVNKKRKTGLMQRLKTQRRRCINLQKTIGRSREQTSAAISKTRNATTPFRKLYGNVVKKTAELPIEKVEPLLIAINELLKASETLWKKSGHLENEVEALHKRTKKTEEDSIKYRQMFLEYSIKRFQTQPPTSNCPPLHAPPYRSK